MGGSVLNNKPALGWHRAVVGRRDGSKADVYYFAPDGTSLRSGRDVQRWLDARRELNIVEMDEGWPR